MNRREDSRGRLIAFAAGLAGLLLAAPIASAAGPAVDEYTLEYPSARDGALGGGGGLTRSPEPPEAGDQAGVAGETTPASSPLGSGASTISGAPLAFALLIASALACVLLAASRLRPSQPR